MSQRPRTDLLITGLGVGGAEKQLLILAAELQRRGWPVRVISMMAPGRLADAFRDAELALVHLNLSRGRPDPRGVTRLLQEIRRVRPQVLLSFLYHANVLGRIVGSLARVPCIVSSMRNERFGSPRRDVMLRRTDRLGHVNTTNSELAAAGIRSRNLVPRRDIVVIPNAIDADRFHSAADVRHAARAELGLPPNTFAWLLVARLEPQKDLHTAIHAFASLNPAAARLLIAGDGPQSEELQRLARQLGVGDRVLFLGLRNDVPRLFAAADGVVLSSAWEGMPNTVMEAMAAGRPVVATAVGGVPELIQNGTTGILVEPRDADALASGLQLLASLSTDEREQLCDAARQRVRDRFSVGRVVDQWEALLLEAMDDRGQMRSSISTWP